MTYEQILALLREKFSGVRKDGLVAMARVLSIQATTEDDAKSIIDKLTDAQVNAFVKDFRADVDKEISASNKTFEDNLKKKFDFVTKTEPGGGGEPKPNEDVKPQDMADVIKQAVAEAVAPFREKIATFETKNIADTRLAQLNAKLADCKDETFKTQTLKDFARMSFADDDAFAEYLTDKAEDIAKANQNVANESMRGASAPMFANKTDDGVSKAVANYVASQNPDENKFSGRSV